MSLHLRRLVRYYSDAPLPRPNVPHHTLRPLVLPLPERTKTSEWFVPGEFHHYLQPLYQRGWQLRFHVLQSQNIVTHTLCDRTYILQTWSDATNFITRLSAIADSESHHPIALHTHYKNSVVNLTLALRTNTATRCPWAAPPLPAPGVTARDLRLAIRLEELYTTRFGGGAPSVLPPLAAQPSLDVVHRLLNVPAAKLALYCTACGGQHARGACPAHGAVNVNANVDLRRDLPRCAKCARRHAPMAACPKERDVFVDPAPEGACTNCGGAHWLVDCRKPQIERGEARKLMLSFKPSMTLEG